MKARLAIASVVISGALQFVVSEVAACEYSAGAPFVGCKLAEAETPSASENAACVDRRERRQVKLSDGSEWEVSLSLDSGYRAGAILSFQMEGELKGATPKGTRAQYWIPASNRALNLWLFLPAPYNDKHLGIDINVGSGPERFDTANYGEVRLGDISVLDKVQPVHVTIKDGKAEVGLVDLSATMNAEAWKILLETGARFDAAEAADNLCSYLGYTGNPAGAF